MAKRITKQINSGFYPTIVGDYLIHAYGGKMKRSGGKMYKLGSFLGDMGRLWADNALSVFGASDVIGDGAYHGNAFKNISGVTSNLSRTAGQVAANMVAPGFGGIAMGGLQSGIGSVADDEALMRDMKNASISNLPAQPSYLPTFANGGSINIKPSKRGTFTAAATKHGASVQEFASRVLANKENYSPAMVKKANFARNASKWNHGTGGFVSSIIDRTHNFANGGTHEQSPYGGIPMGNGNLVEGGEYMYTGKNGKKYIFSDRF